MSCKYCNPNAEIMKSYQWENLYLDSVLETNTVAYIVPAINLDRACMVINDGKTLLDLVLNYCPMCGEKLPK